VLYPSFIFDNNGAFQGRQRRFSAGKTVIIAATLTACHRYHHHILFRKIQAIFGRQDRHNGDDQNKVKRPL
jgi:hypothetical protein